MDRTKLNFRNRRGGSRKGRCAFTLVELLVVVAILALLISILMPSLNKAGERARMAVCKINLKGLSVAFGNYIGANNQWYPAGAAWGGGSEYTWDSILQPLYQQYGLLHCPGDKLERASWYEARGIPEGSRYPRSYAISRAITWMGPSEEGRDYKDGDGNSYPYAGSTPPYPWPGGVGNTARVTDPGETILVGEQWEAAYWVGNWRPGMYKEYHGCGVFTHWESYWPNRGPTLDVHRNNDTANYLFCDGHVIMIMDDDPNLDLTRDYYYWRRDKN